MSPFKSSLARSAGKLLGVLKEKDLSLRGVAQTNRFIPPPPIPIVASGGNIADGVQPGNGYKYHVFTTSGALTVTSGTQDMEYLVVGGGGAGGNVNVGGGGGGAGGLRSGILAANGNPVTVTIGDGGNYPGNNGGHTIFGSIRSEGGGCAGNPGPNIGSNGGSGGGSSQTQATSKGLGNFEAGTSNAVPSQGYPGGVAGAPGSNEAGGGGGGAGGAGEDGVNDGNGGDGGIGSAHPAYAAPLSAFNPMPSDWKTAVGPTGLYGGGGGGGIIRSPGSEGAPGPGGGGAGGGTDTSLNASPIVATAGVHGTGGGGGGSAYAPTPDSQPGGNGIVIVRYTV
jgi:hypothetical protein